MLKNELKIALAMLGTAFVPMCVQADQPMDASQDKQAPAYTSGEMVKAGQLPGGYNQSADYMCENGWDVFLTADYIYWDWVQDAEMGAGVNAPSHLTSVGHIDLSTAPITPGYASGFQVGLGFNMKGMDDWNFYSEYTWYKNSASFTKNTDVAVTSPTVSVHSDMAGDISMNYSNADFLLQRPFYFGKKVTSNFYTGLKALWITRETSINLTDPATFTYISTSLATGTITGFNLTNKVSSWGLGPKFGMDSNWLLGYGFKMLSNISASVLYTRYTQSIDTDITGNVSLLGSPITVATDIDSGISNYGTIRPILETYLGLGWGSFFCDNDFHLDLSIGYDFNVFWDYVTVAGGSSPSSNMYLHGLNVQARFDF